MIFVPKSGPAVLSCEHLKASCTLLKTCAAMGAVKAETPPTPIPTCPCTSWGLTPIHVLQSLFPPLAREPEHPATLGVLGCRISILFIIKYFCSVGFGFFLLLSLTSHLSPSSASHFQFAHQGMMSTFLF